MPRERKMLRYGAWFELDAGWIGEARATELLHALVASEPWEQRPINMFGREIMQPRLISWAGELPYKYSGQTLEPRKPGAILSELLSAAQEAAGVPFNHVLLNRYRNGGDHMGWHSDNEPELGYEPVIAALSLGASRKFMLRPKAKKDKRRRALQLSHGSLFVMGGRMQHTWRHAVPKAGAVEDERINLTFRWLKGPPGWRDPANLGPR